MKFMEIKDIVCKLMLLSKAVRKEVMGENYLLFKKFIQLYTLNKRTTRSDILVNHDIFTLIKSNSLISRHQSPVELKPFVFYTDGGVHLDDYNSFIDCLFGEGKFLYSSSELQPKDPE